MDGTLIDSVDLHAKAWVLAFQDYGHKVRFEEVRKQIGKGGDQLMPVFCPRKKSSGLGKDWRPAAAPSLRSAISPELRHSPLSASCSNA